MTLTDAFLIVSPIVILRASRLESGLRLRLTAAVSISVVATIFVVIHVALTMSIGGLWAAIFGVVEVRIPSSLSHWSDHTCLQVFVAIFVCNIYVALLVAIMVGRARCKAAATVDETILSTVIRLDNNFQDPICIVMDSADKPPISRA